MALVLFNNDRGSADGIAVCESHDTLRFSHRDINSARSKHMNTLKSFLIVALSLSVMTPHLTALAQSGGQQGAPPAPSGAPLSPEALDKLLAPIALYPDALILQIVQCAASPYQVKQVHEWQKANPDLKGTAAQDAATDQGFDASFVAIVLFPQVLQMMADQPDWTRDLGQAFSKDREGVFESIQRLRTQAQTVGNLKTNEHQQVETVTTQGGQQVIVIQPANPQVVYVPTYNPTVVYTQPATTVVVEDDNDGGVIGAAVIGFTAGVIVGALADDDDDHYYYSCGGWGWHGAALCNEGWEDYYEHRENMANDYYEHRENMAAQRGENQGNRQDNRTENQGNRQTNRNENQSDRQTGRTENQGDRQTNRSTKQSDRKTDPATNRATTSSRGAAQKGAQPTARTTGSNTGAMGGYQRGSTERASSARGNASKSRSTGSASRSGGGGGGRSGGGRR